MLDKKEQQLLDVIEAHLKNSEDEICRSIEIVTVEVFGARKSPTIRVYIDTPHGVSFDELSHAQVVVNGLMDKLDPFPGAYTLEVSSPGIDRPLRTPEHFRRYIGEEAYIKAVEQIDGRATWSGTIKDVSEEAVTVCVDGKDYVVPFQKIKQSNLKGKISFTSLEAKEQ